MLLVFSVLHQCFSENVMLKFLGKAYFGKHLVPFLFTQFMDFKTLLVQSSVSCNDPPFSFSNIRLFDFTTPFPIVITIRRLKAVPVPYSNYNCFKFCHQVIWKQIWSTFLFWNSLSFLVFLNFGFQLLMDVLWRIYL